MNLEEKITHLQNASMEEARAKGNAIIDAHRQALESLQEKHQAEAHRQSETRIKSETTNAKQQLNQATAKAQVELKRQLGKRQSLLKDKLFVEVRDLVNDYMQTDAYADLLSTYINKAAAFAKGDPLTIYINPSDSALKGELEKRTGMTLTISREDFIGGIRAVIPGRNILIDHSFKGMIESEYEEFNFQGGDTIG